MTQYLDTLKDLGSNSRSNTILMPHSPGGMTDFLGELRTAITVGMESAQLSAAAAATAPASRAAAPGL
ncbi:MAG TPA: hypothetical protein VN515_03105, partial [Terriglobales bacterium]|nr:hypothetical protein [Terriglobales bacterium]